MMTNQPKQQFPRPKKAVIQWLLDSDPSIRWQVMRDLSKEPDGLVAAERSRVASEGWGAQLLARQGRDGRWGDGVSTPKWESTLYTLLLLRDRRRSNTKTGVGRSRTLTLIQSTSTWKAGQAALAAGTACAAYAYWTGIQLE